MLLTFIGLNVILDSDDSYGGNMIDLYGICNDFFNIAFWELFMLQLMLYLLCPRLVTNFCSLNQGVDFV